MPLPTPPAIGWRTALARRLQPLLSPPMRHFLRAGAARLAALGSTRDRACAAEALARVEESAGAVLGLLALACAAAFGPGCGVGDNRDTRGTDSVFQELRTDIVRPAERPEPVDPGDFVWPTGDARRVEIELESKGDTNASGGRIAIELYPELAPQTVAAFERLAAEGFYDGTTFHRVIPGFMIQGGDPNSRDQNPRNDGKGGPPWTLPDEFSRAPHVRGVVSLANRGAPDSGGSQFFIMLADRQDLDGRYTVFGRVVSGMDVVDRIAAVETDRIGRWGPRDRPVHDVRIARVVPASGAAAQLARADSRRADGPAALRDADAAAPRRAGD